MCNWKYISICIYNDYVISRGKLVCWNIIFPPHCLMHQSEKFMRKGTLGIRCQNRVSIAYPSGLRKRKMIARNWEPRSSQNLNSYPRCQVNALCTILVSRLRPKEGLEWRVIHFLDFSFRPRSDEMSFGTLWRHSECDGDLNKFEAGLGTHYVRGIIPGSGQGLFQKIEFVPPRGEMRLKKLNSSRSGAHSWRQRSHLRLGGRRNISHSRELQDRRDQRGLLNTLVW